MLVLKASRLPGARFGVFATRDIAASTVLWRYDPAVDQEWTAAQLARKSADQRSSIEEYAFLYRGTWIMCCGLLRFANHSRTPNLVTDQLARRTIAARDIASGEELTEDYRVLCEDIAANPPPWV